MALWWKNWSEVNRLVENKVLILYGRSEDWIPKSLTKIKEKPAYIIDRNPIYADTKYRDIPIYPPEKILTETKDEIFIVITSGVYEGIVKYLTDNGFEAGRDFCCSPEFKDYALLEEIRNYEQRVIVSSSDYHDSTMARYSRAGGGIFNYHIGPNSIEQLVKGSFRQLTKVNEYIYAVEFVECMLYQFDLNFNVVSKYPLDRANYCGLDYDPVRDALILINAGIDTISFYDINNFKLLERIEYSDKNISEQVTSQHHLNDVCVYGDRLFVSYFSHSGNWKLGVHDGGISELNLRDLSKPPTQIISDLWKPHSPKIIDGDLCYLDSMRGRLYMNNQVIAGEFDGFARGLASDGRFFYIGQSEDMYMSRRFGTTNNIMLNAGFYLFDPETKASRFYPMLDSMNIHDILILD